MVYKQSNQSEKLFSKRNQKKIVNPSTSVEICTTTQFPHGSKTSKIPKKLQCYGHYTKSGISDLYQFTRPKKKLGRPVNSGVPRIAEVKRHDVKFYNDLVRSGPKHDPIRIPDGFGKPGLKRVLRPKFTPPEPTLKAKSTSDGIIGSFSVSIVPLLAIINEFLHKHTSQRSHCEGVGIDFIDPLKCGLSYRIRVTCTVCGFTGERKPLFDTVNNKNKRGPKQSQMNVGFGLGMQNTPIGPTKMVQALSHATLAAPSLRQCQRIANLVADKTLEVAEMDRDEKQKLVKAVMQERGHASLIPLSNDTQYNGKTGRARHTPGHAGNSAQCITMENATSSHYVLDRQLANRICTGRTNAKRKYAQRNVHCMSKSGRHGNLKCTRTQKQGDIIDEGLLAAKSAQVLASKGVIGSVICSDADADIIKGFSKHMPNILWNKDLIHNTKAQITAIERAPLSRGFFDGMHTGKQRRKAKQALANDIGMRCGVIHLLIHEKANGDLVKMQKIALSTIDQLVKCYSGDHKKCRYSSVVGYSCSGIGVNCKTWFMKSGYLTAQNITKLTPSFSDKDTLKRLVQIKLGPESIEQTFRRNTTQPNECINNSIRGYLMRNRGFNRNGPGRIDTCILKWNNGAVKCSELLAKSVGVVDPLGSPSLKVIADTETRLKKNRIYQRQTSVRKRIRKKRAKLLVEHFDCAKKRHNEVAYVKNQLEQEVLTHDATRLSSSKLTKYRRRIERLNTTWKRAKNADNERLLKNRTKRKEKQLRDKLADCIHCNKKVQLTKLSYNCAGCNNKQHIECDNLITKTDIKLNVNYSILPWYCDQCKSNMILNSNSCRFCTLQVTDSDKALSCDICAKWQHIECQYILSKVHYKQAISTGNMPKWSCYYCNKIMI
jgi:hypothetical protein